MLVPDGNIGVVSNYLNATFRWMLADELDQVIVKLKHLTDDQAIS